MTHSGVDTEVTPVWRPQADVPPLVRPTSSVRFVAPGSITGGQFGLFHWEMKPEAKGASPHFHRTFSESFYVLEGTVGLYNGAKWVEACAGDFLYVPHGGVHGFRNSSGRAAAMLILFAPGTARELFFQELAEIDRTGRVLTPQEWTKLYSKHDQFMV